MRRGVTLGGVLALVLALPAAARVVDETVTLAPGQSVTLKTVFDRDTRYTVTLSGLVTLTVSGTPITLDPLFSYSGSCQNPSARTNVRLLDARGRDVFSPFSTTPRPTCRPDHTYSFTLNGPLPNLAGTLDGRVTAKNDVTVSPGNTATGAFTLKVQAGPRTRRDVVFKVVAKKELVTLNDELLADVRLSGAGRIVDLDSAKTTKGLFFITLVWLTREDTHLTLRPEGEWTYLKTAKSVSGGLRVTRSSDGSCLKAVTPRAISLNGRKQRAVVNLGGRCAGLTFLRWYEPKSEAQVSVSEVRLGK